MNFAMVSGRKRFHGVLALACVLICAAGAQQKAADSRAEAQKAIEFPTVLYGAAYYNEYMPGDRMRDWRKDIELMKAAGLNVVRMGESTWSLWEPEDGKFEYAWMDQHR